MRKRLRESFKSEHDWKIYNLGYDEGNIDAITLFNLSLLWLVVFFVGGVFRVMVSIVAVVVLLQTPYDHAD